MNSSLVLINNDCHHLFCQLYGIKYDQIGFVHDGIMHLYWVIPTQKEGYHGAEEKFELKGAVMYYSVLNTGRCSKRLFERALTSLSKKIIIEFNEQYQKCNPLGVAYINRVLEILIPGTLTSPSYVSESQLLESFCAPIIHKRDRSNTPVHCVDLLEVVVRNPEPATLVHERRLRQVASEALTAFSHLTTLIYKEGRKILDADVIASYRSLATNIRDCLLLSVPDSPTVHRNLERDELLVIRVDGSFEDTVQKFRAAMRRLLRLRSEGGAPTINAAELLEFTNALLSFFDTQPIKTAWPQDAPIYSYLVAVVNQKVQETLAVGESVVALSGQGLESLTYPQLRQLLEKLALYEDDHTYDFLREEATRKYYERQEDPST